MTGELFRFIRVSKRMTQRQLAAKMGVSKGLIGLIETGRCNVTPRVKKRLIDATGVTPEQLARLTEIMAGLKEVADK